MKPRVAVASVAALTLFVLGPSSCPSGTGLVQVLVSVPGFVEIHTPGSGAPEELPTPTVVSALLGGSVDLNRATYVRTYIDDPTIAAPRAILILIPGFLGGAKTFDRLARDLVISFNGGLEVWLVDRRPNQLEDRLGAIHAFEGAELADFDAIIEGAQFYFADVDNPPTGNFPGSEDLDVDLDGVLDPQGMLEDPFTLLNRLPLILTQNDARYMAHWGIDTYVRDWKILVEAARAVVGSDGLVLLGGHSQGTSWSTIFAAYDFDPDPATTVAGHSLIDGLVLLEGGGVGTGSATPPNLASYNATVAGLETNGGADVFLTSFGGLPLQGLGQSGEVAAIAGFYQPAEPALIQRTPVLGSGLPGLLLGAPATNRAIAGMFLDDDFSPIGAFRVSVGFTDNASNAYIDSTVIPGILPIYVAEAAAGGALRTWKSFDDPTLPICPPNVFNVSPGCAIIDNGPPSAPLDPPVINGLEAEVTNLDDFLKTQFGNSNGFEWYFSSGRPNLDFSYGRDSSALVAEALLVDPADEGPLVITQNASVDVPVLAIGGSNGLTPEEKSFDSYLGSIATPPAAQEVHILEGYAHVDVITATDNGAVPLIVDFANRLIQSKLLATF